MLRWCRCVHKLFNALFGVSVAHSQHHGLDIVGQEAVDALHTRSDEYEDMCKSLKLQQPGGGPRFLRTRQGLGRLLSRTELQKS